MKFGELIEHNKRNIFLQKSCRQNEAGRLVSDLFLFFFKKTLYEAKSNGLHLSFNIFR